VKVSFRQFALTVTLAGPLVFAIATAPPFSAETRAQGASHMLGPNFPVKLDANGDGQPSAGDEGVAPRRAGGGTIEIPSRWQCDPESTNNLIQLSNRDPGGRFRTLSRVNGVLNQSVTAGGIVNGTARDFSYEQTRLGATTATGSISLTDANNDGVLDGVRFRGTLTASISFVFSGNGDFVTVPWSQVSALGLDLNGSCVGALPQIWVPLADTNGDGRGDAVVFDLDGDGRADADLLAGPAIAVPSVPTMGPIARLILMALIGLTGAWFLSRRRTDGRFDEGARPAAS
jgi:hypothetical protein